jgi:hypothetical protein
MDLTEVFDDPRAKAKRAEALRVIHTGIQGAVRDWEMFSALYISKAAALAYDEAKRLATRLLFEEYAKIAFERELDAEVFIGFLPEIQRKVDLDLQVEYDGEKSEHKGKWIVRIDFQEAKSCQLEWEQKAWERPKRRLFQHKPSIIQRFRQFLRRGSRVTVFSEGSPPQLELAQSVVAEQVSVDTSGPMPEVPVRGPDLMAVELSMETAPEAADPDRELVKRVVDTVGIESFLAQFPQLKRTPLTDYTGGRIKGRVSGQKQKEIILAARKCAATLDTNPNPTRTENSD